MDYMWLCSVIIHTISNIFGIIFNVLLIFLILRKTPQQLRSYSILIFNFALCDLFACSSALLVQQRIVSGGSGMFFLSHGPCMLLGPQTCFVLHSFSLHCYSHALFSLLFSFSYRLYILKRRTPSNRIIVAIIILMYLPSLYQFVSFCFANESEAKLKALIQQKFGYDMKSECVSGLENVFNWKALPMVLYMTLPVTPVYFAIHILRKLTMSMLDKGTVMSENAKRMHSHLLQALTIQACLPALFLLAVIAYVTEQLDIYRHPLLEYSCSILIGLIPMLSPLTSFFLIRPYKIWMYENILQQHQLF